ncbi:MAG: FAD:protein FMN transferase [Alphaproteobacteria bacterium]|nr:FAD:protein FMN transferase [Alphaproteobacteria bacterium]
MGTGWSVKLVAPATALGGARSIVAEALDAVVAQMSTWEADSDVSRFNAAPAGTWQALPEALYRVLSHALAVAHDSAGAYDPTVGPLVDLWGFGPTGPRTEPPDEGAIAVARADTGWSRIALDPATRRARQPGGVALDLSAIAKGFAVDLVSERLDRGGFADHLVEIGGELVGRGVKPDGTPWWVLLEQPPGMADRPETVIALHGLAVATSGDYRRYFAAGGKRHAHTIDPRTGRPASHPPALVAVLHRSCMAADALSTALTVLGADAGMAFARERDVAALFLVRDAAGTAEHMTPAFAAMLD